MKLASPQPSRDDKTRRAQLTLIPLSLLVLLVAVVTTVFEVLTYAQFGNAQDPTYPYCSPDGQVRFILHFMRNDLWDTSLFLSVTLGFGHFSFAEAKAIDVAFDLILGRCSQLLLAFAIYPILRRSFLRSMEVNGIAIQLAFPLFLERISAGWIWSLLQHATKRRSREDNKPRAISKPRRYFDWRLMVIFLVAAYVLITPTILSAATSYQSRSVPFVAMPNSGNYVKAQTLFVPDFVIMDGARIGLTENFPVSRGSDLFNVTYDYSSTLTNVSALWKNYEKAYTRAMHLYPRPVESDICPNVTKLPDSQTVHGTGNPPLCSFTLYPREACAYRMELLANFTASTFTIQDKTWNLSGPPLSIVEQLPHAATVFYASGNLTFGSDYVLRHAVCQPTNAYQWGFSFLMLFVFCVISCLVAVLLLILRLDAWWNSQADRYELSASTYRDVLDLADELRDQYGDDICSKHATDLEKEVKRLPAKIELNTEDLLPSRSQPFEHRLRENHSKTLVFLKVGWDDLVAASDTRHSSHAEEAMMGVGSEEENSAVHSNSRRPEIEDG